jgi:hypothetical protein
VLVGAALLRRQWHLGGGEGSRRHRRLWLSLCWVLLLLAKKSVF